MRFWAAQFEALILRRTAALRRDIEKLNLMAKGKCSLSTSTADVEGEYEAGHFGQLMY